MTNPHYSLAIVAHKGFGIWIFLVICFSVLGIFKTSELLNLGTRSRVNQPGLAE